MDPVIVVGAGPVGLSLSLALASTGRAQRRARRGAWQGPAPTCPYGRPARGHLGHGPPAGLYDTARRGRALRRLAHHAAPQPHRRRPAHHLRGPPGPLHLPQHALTRGLRDAAAAHPLVQLVTDSKLDSLEQDDRGVTAHTRGAETTWWRGSYLVGCDGARSTVRKLLGIRFPGRTAVERHAVAALRTELPWPGEALLHRAPAPGVPEVSARPLPDGVWRLDWLLPARGELVTPDALVTLIRDTLAVWCGGAAPRTTSSTPGCTRCTTGSPGAGATAAPSSPGTPPTCWARSARRGSTRGSGTPRTSPGSCPWPGTRAPPRPCSTATRTSAAPPSRPGCAPPTRRCPYCAGAAGCGRTCPAPPAPASCC